MNEVKCVKCKRRTTRDEADHRNFNTGYCGNCGETLVDVDRCGSVHTGAICYLKDGHRGMHEGGIQW